MIDRIAHLDHLYRTFVQVQLRYWAGHPKRSRFPPGADGETLPAFAQHLQENLCLISEQLRDGRYSFSPLLERKAITPGGGEKRFSRATLRDTLVQKAIAAVVEPALDSMLPDSLHAFRRWRPAGPGLHRAISQVAQACRTGRFWVLQEDVRAYFDHIRHDLLLETLASMLPGDRPVLDLYAAYLAAPRLVAGRTLPRQRGLPVGTVLANFLANVYLLPLDRAMDRAGFHYLRYCDDLLVLASSEGEAREARKLVAEMIGARGLSLNAEKARLLPPGALFVYLGYEFEGSHLRVSQRAVEKFRRKVRHVTARSRWPRLRPSDLESPHGRVVLDRLVRQANRLLASGGLGTWPRYFARAEFDEQFRELDRWIRQRVRAALFHRWRESDARHLPARRLQAAGLRSLVGEYWSWRRAWQNRARSLLAETARLERLRQALQNVKARTWDARERRYRFRPGPDGLTLEDVAADERAFLLDLQGRLLDGTYRFGPFVEYARPRQGRNQPRWIARPGLADAVVSRALAAVLTSRLDRHLPDHVHSYRPGRGSWTAIGQLRRLLLSTDTPRVVRADVAGYLDEIDLARLERVLHELLPSEGGPDTMLRDLLRSYLVSGRWRVGEGLLAREKGLPRGGPLTPLLGNLYLLGLDRALVDAGYQAVRYADDVVVVASGPGDAGAAWKLIREWTSALGLPLSVAKSGVRGPHDAYEFLGYRITGRHFDVRPYAVNRLKRRVRRVTRRHRWRHLTLKGLQTQEGRDELGRLVRQVNRLLVYGRGQDWPSRFARCTDERTFRELDRWIAERIRACVTGRWSPRNARMVPCALLGEMGLVRLVSLYYHARRRIAAKAARAALRRISSSPEAGS